MRRKLPLLVLLSFLPGAPALPMQGDPHGARPGSAREADHRSPGYTAYTRADRLFVARKFPECLSALDEALQLDAKLVPAWTLKAKLAMSMNRFDIARKSLENALASDPSSAYAQFLYGLQYYLANDLEAALPQFEKARKLNPTDPRTTLYLGLTRESLGGIGEAMSLYEETVRLEQAAGAPQAETFLTGARLLLLLGRNADCESWIGHALKLEPDSRDAHFELARLLVKQGKAAQAAKEGETALHLNGGMVTDSQIHYLLIGAYRESGQSAHAARQAEAVRSLEVKTPDQ